MMLGRMWHDHLCSAVLLIVAIPANVLALLHDLGKL